MPLGQFVPGTELKEAPVVFDSSATFNRGIKAGTGFGTPSTSVVLANAGSNATINLLRGTDFAGTLQLTAGTAGISAGTQATLTFASQLASAPSSVVVDLVDNAGGAPLSVGAGSISASGFSILTAATTASHVYTITYVVVQ